MKRFMLVSLTLIGICALVVGCLNSSDAPTSTLTEDTSSRAQKFEAALKDPNRKVSPSSGERGSGPRIWFDNSSTQTAITVTVLCEGMPEVNAWGVNVRSSGKLVDYNDCVTNFLDCYEDSGWFRVCYESNDSTGTAFAINDISDPPCDMEIATYLCSFEFNRESSMKCGHAFTRLVNDWLFWDGDDQEITGINVDDANFCHEFTGTCSVDLGNLCP